MANTSKTKLVLNIGNSSLNFFETRPSLQTSLRKRVLGKELTSPRTGTKKQNISRFKGRALNVSAKLSRLKTISSINKLSNYKPASVGLSKSKNTFVFNSINNNSANVLLFKKDSDEIGTNADSVSTTNSPTTNIEFLTSPETKQKTTNKVSVKSNSQKNVKNRVSFKSDVQIGPKRAIGDKTKQLPNKASPGRSVTSALFSRNPDIPVLQKTDSTSATQKCFSTQSFKDADIAPNLILYMEKLGFTSMTLVQQLSIPVILEGHDALIKSQTGSGKTLSYALPLIQKLMTTEPKIKREDGLLALIVVPTRELAIQTYQCLENLCKVCVWVVPGYLIGGEKKKTEKARIRKGINVLVATPGRLLDHISSTNVLELNKVRYLVLDEADRMLDMGYERSVKSILHSLNEAQGAESRQSVLLSATLTGAIEKLAGISLRKPQIIDVTAGPSGNSSSDSLSDECLVTPENLSHHFMLVPTKLRLVSLAAFIIQKCKFADEKKMLIFMSTQDMVDYHTSLFSHVFSRRSKTQTSMKRDYGRRRGRDIGSDSDESEGDKSEGDDDNEIEDDSEDDIHFMKLHGSMTQPERTAVFKSFQEMRAGVLISTDVASRGLDLPHVHWIVQYNAACNAADYVHRVGRTARADSLGSAVVFVSPTETGYLAMLGRQGIRFEEIKMETTLKTLTNRALYDLKVERPAQSLEVGATRLQDKFENAVLSDKDMHYMAVQAYVSFIRSYAAIPKAARENFCFKLLHLGHCAKSFALRDPPAVLGSKGAKYSTGVKRRYEADDDGPNRKPLMKVRKVISEFDSGLDDLEDQMKNENRKGLGKSKKEFVSQKNKSTKNFNKGKKMFKFKTKKVKKK